MSKTLLRCLFEVYDHANGVVFFIETHVLAYCFSDICTSSLIEQECQKGEIIAFM